MIDEDLVSCIEALLFASGKCVDSKTLENILEIDHNKLLEIIELLKTRLEESKSGLILLEIDNGFQLATNEKYYEQICKLMDNLSLIHI